MASVLKVDKLDPQSGTALEIGTSGDTITIPSGATIVNSGTATGFGGGDLSFGGDTFGADQTVGANDAYAFSLETSGNVAIKMDASGHVTKPLQSCCCVRMNANMSALGSSSTTDIVFDTERFDVNADFNTTNYTFTAPVTGKYLVQYQVRLDMMDIDAGYYQLSIVSSNATYNTTFDPDGFDKDPDYYSFTGGLLIDMDASDTCKFQIVQNAGAAVAVVVGGASDTYASIGLLC